MHANKSFIGRLLLIGLVLVSIIFFPRIAQAEAHDPIWNARTNGAPAFLQIPDNSHKLWSEYELATLSGHLINSGVADAQVCPSGGLQRNGQANACGVKHAMPAALVWQNHFNTDILNTSQRTGVPPILIKNIFTWESQFWPQTVFIRTSEYGLGHMTQMGADSLLRWNYPFYDSFCNANMPADRCQQVYVEQPDYVQAMLRGLVVQQVDADCSNCPYALDLKRAGDSIPIFANTLVANANLVKHYIKFYTGSDAANEAGYQDLWDFALASYNAGPGCFQTALSRTVYSGLPLTWKNVSSKLDVGCQGSIAYVKFISKTDHYRPQDDPGINPTVTPTVSIPTATPTTSVQTATPTISQTETSGTPVSLVPSSLPTSTGGGTLTAVTTSTHTPPAVSTTPQAPATIAISNLLKPLHVGNELIIKFNPLQRATVLQNLATLKMNLVPGASQIQSLDTLVVQVDPNHLNDALIQLKKSTGVEFVEPNYLVMASGLPADANQPNDPLFPNQGNLNRIQVPQAWSVAPANMKQVIVAVLDTGVNVSHPDLINSIWQNPGETGMNVSNQNKKSNGVDDDKNGYMDDWQGWNFVDNNNNVNDDNGHGTHLAGIIAASTNNHTGIAGIAPNARILAVKVLDKNGYGSYANVAQGIIYATNMGARIIELGFGGTGSSELMQSAVDYALAHNVLVVAAAGNGGSTAAYYPAGYYGVIAISALDNSNHLASFSSSGSDISLSAPGTGIISTGLSETYPIMSGTSMASAEVTGVAALMAGLPQYSNVDTLRSALLGSALDLGNPGRDPQYGYGIVQALSALGYDGPVVPTETPVASPTPSGTVTPGPGVHTNGITTETLYGTAQTCSFGDPGGNSIDSSINGISATCSGAYTGSPIGSWTYISMQHIASIQTIQKGTGAVMLDVGFTTTGISPTDSIALELSNDNGTTWNQVTTFTADQTSTNTQSYDVSSIFTKVAQANQAQVRFAGIAGQGNTISINLDEARLDVNGYIPPTVTISTPSDHSTFAYGATVSLSGTASDPQDGKIDSSIVWYSNLSGPVWTGASVSTTTLIPGTHIIYAQAIDSGGAKATAFITITVTGPTDSPHGNFMASTTDLCAECHRTHTAKSTLLVNDPNPVLTSDAFCLSCHTDVSTHSNQSFTGRTEAPFVVRCIQCHDPHGSSNLFDLRANILTSLNPQTTTGTINFTALTGPNSFDDGTSPKVNRLCLACHSGMTNHPGGLGHLDTNGLPTLDYSGLSCIACHPHNADMNPTTQDGFMPVRNTNP